MEHLYRRPLIAFYLPVPPIKGNRGQDFRTLPDNYSETSKALVDSLIRNVQVRQSIIRTALEDDEDIKILSFVGSMQVSDGVELFIDSINKTIVFELAKFRSQHSPEEAFRYLRSRVEASGIFVLLIGDLGSHHTAFNLEDFRGFALSDKIAPFIIINDHDSKAAWSFTLIHELVHVLLGQTGVSSNNSEKEIEKFCNKVASEFLLPKLDLESFNFNDSLDFDKKKELIISFAKERNLSCSMVAYSLYLIGTISKASWLNLNSEFRKLWLEAKEEQRKKAKEKEGGPTYYIIRKHRIGENLISLVRGMMIDGFLTTTKASRVLGVAPKNVHRLFEVKHQ